jgi:hypothetical protein
LIPPWKSILKFVSMRRLIPKSRQDAFATEVFGVLSKDGSGYFPPALVDASLGRTVSVQEPFRVVWIGCDPASHAKSEMALTAIGVTETGLHVILGVCAVTVERCATLQIAALIRQFATRLRLQGHETFVPIIETNGNEIVAQTILRSFGDNVAMPFTRENFDSFITPDVGVLTTYATKLAMVQQTYLAIVDGRIAVASNAIVANRSAFEARAKQPPAAELVQELGKQLKRFRDHDDGSTSGKGPGGEQDDIAMALMMTIYWRVAVIASGNTQLVQER